jgi:hypothetical protein
MKSLPEQIKGDTDGTLVLAIPGFVCVLSLVYAKEAPK